MTTPYATRTIGHPKRCDCNDCAQLRAERVLELLSKAQLPQPPPTADATVFVRAHFRRQPGHLKHYRRTRGAVMQVLRKAVFNS